MPSGAIIAGPLRAHSEDLNDPLPRSRFGNLGPRASLVLLWADGSCDPLDDDVLRFQMGLDRIA